MRRELDHDPGRSTLRPIGPRIEPEGFTGRWLVPVVDGSQHRADARRPLARHHLEVGELIWWDLESREPTRTLQVAEGYRALAPEPGWRTRGDRSRRRASS